MGQVGDDAFELYRIFSQRVQAMQQLLKGALHFWLTILTGLIGGTLYLLHDDLKNCPCHWSGFTLTVMAATGVLIVLASCGAHRDLIRTYFNFMGAVGGMQALERQIGLWAEQPSCNEVLRRWTGPRLIPIRYQNDLLANSDLGLRVQMSRGFAVIVRIGVIATALVGSAFLLLAIYGLGSWTC